MQTQLWQCEYFSKITGFPPLTCEIRFNGRRHLRSEFTRPRDVELLSAMNFRSAGTGESSVSVANSPVEEKVSGNRLQSEYNKFCAAKTG